MTLVHSDIMFSISQKNKLLGMWKMLLKEYFLKKHRTPICEEIELMILLYRMLQTLPTKKGNGA